MITADSLMRVGGALVTVLSIILIGFYILKRSGLVPSTETREGLINVVAKRFVAPKVQLMVVQVGSRFFLLGLSNQGISYLVELSEMESKQVKGEENIASG